MKRLIVLLFALLALMVLTPHPGLAAPPPGHKNTDVATFDCMRGTEHITFQAAGVAQSAAIAGQLLDGTGVVVFTRLVINGQVIFEVRGQANRPDLWSCEVVDNPGVFVDAFITPRG